MHIIKLKECAMRINKRAQIFFYFLSHFLLTISHGKFLDKLIDIFY